VLDEENENAVDVFIFWGWFLPLTVGKPASTLQG
jgi:hypothetical protein